MLQDMRCDKSPFFEVSQEGVQVNASASVPATERDLPWDRRFRPIPRQILCYVTVCARRFPPRARVVRLLRVLARGPFGIRLRYRDLHIGLARKSTHARATRRVVL